MIIATLEAESAVLGELPATIVGDWSLVHVPCAYNHGNGVRCGPRICSLQNRLFAIRSDRPKSLIEAAPVALPPLSTSRIRSEGTVER